MRSPEKAARLGALDARLVVGGLDDEAALARLVEGQQVVFHVAGLVAARRPREFSSVNRDGTARLARAALRAGVSRLVLVSSLAVTGPSRPGETLGEAAGPGPITDYGRSKQEGERAVGDSGVPFSIVRPPAVYGPGDRAFLSLFRLAARGWAPLLGTGNQELTLVYVRDLAQALVMVAESPAALGATYHAGSAAPVTQREFAKAVGRAVGREVRCVSVPPSLVRASLAAAGLATRAFGGAPLLDGDKSRELFASGWVCSSEALHRDTGWRAQTALEDGLAETAAGYRKAGWL